MKNTFIGLTILTTLLGCSKETPKNTSDSKTQEQQNAQMAVSPAPVTTSSEITIIETAEKKEKNEIKTEAAALFAARDFGNLENLANKYRTSKACYADGFWKLNKVYSGITPDDSKSDDEWKTGLAILREWVQAKPNSITARVALANALVSYGWKARGSSFANTVTETGWKLMRERLAEAVQVLKQAETLTEKCPCSWFVLLTAAMGLGAEKAQYEAVFQKAIASEPGFTGYYCQKAYYLLPRWHGVLGDTADFLQKAADQIGGEDGDLLYARVAWYLQGIEGNIFNERELSWERADRGFQVMEKQFPDSLYVQNGRAYIAVMGCEKTLAPRKLVDGLHGKIDPVAWTSEENFRRLTQSLYPH